MGGIDDIPNAVWNREIVPVSNAEIATSTEKKVIPQESEKNYGEDLLKKYFVRHLLIMIVMHGSLTFNYFLLIYLTNSFEKIYITAIFLAVSEIIGFFISGYLLERFGIRKVFIIS